MSRTIVRVSVFAVAAAGFALAGGLTAADKPQVKLPKSIGQLMGKGHGSKGLMKAIEKSAKDGNWESAQNDAALLKTFGELLPKFSPDKGSKESWAKLTGKYKDETAAVDAAAQKKDAAGVSSALGVLKKSCQECHDAHQEG